jgi:hypothetical protein
MWGSPRAQRGTRGHRWAVPKARAGKVAVERPRVRDLAGREMALPSWERAVAEDSPSRSRLKCYHGQHRLRTAALQGHLQPVAILVRLSRETCFVLMRENGPRAAHRCTVQRSQTR